MEKPFPAYRGSDPYIFISYSHADEDDVFAQIRWLQDEGINVWYDTTGIGVGSEWNDEIAKAIKVADRFLYFITPSSVASEHCRRELNFAQSEGRQVVVCYLQETDLPDGLRLSLDNRQAILKHRISEDDYRSTLVRALSSGAVDEAQGTPTHTARGRGWPSFTGGASAVILVAAFAWWYLGLSWDWPPVDQIAGGESAIAVMPFANMSNDPDQEFFSDGIAEDILNELARSNALTVRAHSSSFSLKNQRLDLQAIGARLNVSYVLEGSVRRSGERLRVTVQLSDVDLDEPIWSDRYDREMTDLFAVQDEITAEVSAALSAEFGSSTPLRQTANTESYEAMLIGRHHLNRFDTAEALRWLTRAAELDPGNFEPWANIYKTRNIMLSAGYFADMEEYYRGQQNYADRVLARYPLHPEILAGQALTKFVLDRAYQESVNELARLVQAQRNNLSAHRYLAQVLSAVGRHAESVRAASRVVEIDPLSPLARSTYVTSLLLAGRVAEARSAVNSYGEDASGYSRLHVAWAEGDVAAMRSALDAGTESPIWEAWAVVVERLEASSGVEVASPSTRSRQESRFVQSVIARAEGRIVDALRIDREAILAGDGFAIFTLAAPYPGMRATYADYYAHPGYQKMLIEFSLDVDSRAKITVPNLPF